MTTAMPPRPFPPLGPAFAETYITTQAAATRLGVSKIKIIRACRAYAQRRLADPAGDPTPRPNEVQCVPVGDDPSNPTLYLVDVTTLHLHYINKGYVRSGRPAERYRLSSPPAGGEDTTDLTSDPTAPSPDRLESESESPPPPTD